MGRPKFEAGPEHGTEMKEPKKKRVKTAYTYISARIASILWIGINGYLLYAFCYVVLWRRVRMRNNGAAIAILVIFCVLNLYAIVAWFAVHVWGPGKVTDAYKRPSAEDPDAAFLCDEAGYSLYCSYCKHIKPNRTHHSSFTDTCIPTMDHFCPWIGSVVGQGNRKFFIQFVWAVCCSQLLVLITLFIYQNQRVPHINGNSIALYIVSGVAWAFTGIVLVQHAFYMMWSHTTLEHMGYRRHGSPYINIPTSSGFREVVQPKVTDIIIPKASPFDLGTWKNVTTVMGPIYTWLLPIREKIYEPLITPEVMKKLTPTPTPKN